jgi:hypothetical protein
MGASRILARQSSRSPKPGRRDQAQKFDRHGAARPQPEVREVGWVRLCPGPAAVTLGWHIAATERNSYDCVLTPMNSERTVPHTYEVPSFARSFFSECYYKKL